MAWSSFTRQLKTRTRSTGACCQRVLRHLLIEGHARSDHRDMMLDLCTQQHHPDCHRPPGERQSTAPALSSWDDWGHGACELLAEPSHLPLFLPAVACGVTDEAATQALMNSNNFICTHVLSTDRRPEGARSDAAGAVQCWDDHRRRPGR